MKRIKNRDILIDFIKYYNSKKISTILVKDIEPLVEEYLLSRKVVKPKIVFESLKVNIKKRWRSRDLQIFMPHAQERCFVPEIDEEKMDIQVISCSIFGCGKTLSMQEKLFGTVCINCQKKKTKQNVF